MTYQQTIDYLYVLQPPFHLVGGAAYKPGLQNTEMLMEHLHHPERRFMAIHIAGTNGKGSTSHLIAASLHAAGLRVGLYTSPHLVDFRERIRVSTHDKNQPMQMIEESRVVRFVEENKTFLETVKPSFFETTMALAFQYFAEQQVDVAVVEVGLGGRLDSTNIMPPLTRTPQPHGVLLSVITNIGYDHTEFLGHTLPAIAREKAGIMKPNVPCVIGERKEETEQVFIEAAQRNGIWGEGLESDHCQFWFADQCEYLRRTRLKVAPKCQLEGEYQAMNMQTAFVALRAVWNRLGEWQGFSQAVKTGFEQVCTLTGLRGRWEVLSSQPLVICDTGHNSHGLRHVVHQLEQIHTERLSKSNDITLRIVFGMVNDKDVDVVIDMMPHDAVYYLTQAQTHRAIPVQLLQKKWNEAMPGTSVHVYDNVEAAIRAALNDMKEGNKSADILFIGGSNYVVGEALKCIDACGIKGA
ncbi:MAG: bifunctional folylpolyglutamate synthase/dihydrofolate synthase [Paludibacteraceae bacterium]|nr:bifunctional folylpolyglutamate synthase/dihydrofolate synthase [Paludibacteraceae bacterium]